MMALAQIGLGIILIIQGLFLWFVLAFNGGVGESFVNYSFFVSALLMIILGGVKFFKSKRSISLILGLASIAFYLPMIWQRFDYKYGPDTGSLSFDTWVIGILLYACINKPNKLINRMENTSVQI